EFCDSESIRIVVFLIRQVTWVLANPSNSRRSWTSKLANGTILSSRASSAASLPPIRRPNHASRFEGIPKTKLQASSASDPETLQSQGTKTARKRLSLRGLEVLHGRLVRQQVVKDEPLAPLSRRRVMSAPPSVQERVDW